MIYEWAQHWGIPIAAIHDLQVRIGGRAMQAPGPAVGKSEAAVSNFARLDASRQGWRLWRNNVGVLEDANGRPVRFGLANDSPGVNKVMKSGDLIGCRPRIITQELVGSTIGQFVSIECKEEGWHYTGTPREQAQQNWALFVLSLGGDARFVSREGGL